MRSDSKQNFVQGAVILTAATLVVKFIGMLYKIPLGNILGAGGMSYFMSAYSIFNPVLALSVSGFPVAVSKMVSESMAKGHWREMQRIRRVSLVLFLSTGIVGSGVLLLGAGAFANLIGNPGAALSIACIAPAVFFCCILSSYRGYYQGMRNMTPTAISQVIEAVAKLVCGIAFSLWMYHRGLAQFDAMGTVFGTPADSLGQAELLVLPWAAAGAVLGVTASTAVGALYLFLAQLIRGDGIERRLPGVSPQPTGAARIAKRLVLIALPVCAAAAVSHVSTLIDVMTIMNRIGIALERDSAVLLAQYVQFLPQNLPLEDIPSYLYGAYSFNTSLFNLVPALTMTLGISALPAISSDWVLGNREQVSQQACSVIKLSALVAIPAGIGLSVMAEPILGLLYPARMAEVAIAAPLLRYLGIAAVIVGITTPMMSIFQAIGQHMTPAVLILCGAGVKLTFNYLLLAVPAINILAAPFGTIICYGLILLAGLLLLRVKAGIKIEIVNTLLKPLFCGIVCGVAAHTSYGLLGQVWQSRLTTLIAIGVGAVFYAVFTLFLRIITKNEALMLPNGKKIVKILEKVRFLG